MVSFFSNFYLYPVIKQLICTMKNTSYFVIFLLLVLAINVHAQNELKDKPFLDNYRFTRIINGTVMGRNLKIADVQGTPYLDTKFNTGEITTSDGAIYRNILLRYNAYTDDLEFSSGKDTYNIEPKSMIKRAKFGGSVFGFRSFDIRGSVQNGFLKILTEGKATLFVRVMIKFLDQEEAKPFMDPKPDRFSDIQKEYFIAIGDTPAKAVSNKKVLLHLFGEKKAEMESFISRGKFTAKVEDGLRNIVEHFNAL